MAEPINLSDIVSGRTGHVFVTIDGARHFASYIKDMKCNVSIADNAGGGLGHTITQSKPGVQTVKLSGNLYQMTSAFADVVDTYRRTGRMPEIEVMVNLSDPQSNAGTQSLVLKRIIITELDMAIIDDSNDKPTCAISMNVGDYELAEKFTVLPQFSA